MEERVSSKRVCRKSALLPRRIFFSLPLPLVPFYIFLFLLLPSQLSSSTTLIGHWQTMLKRTPMSPMKWALYRINDPPDVCVCLREKIALFRRQSRSLKTCFPLRYRDCSILSSAAIISHLEIELRRDGDSRDAYTHTQIYTTHTCAKEDGLSHLHSRTCASGWYHCSCLVREK